MESTNLTRKQQKIFAGNTTITDEQIAVFGSKTQTGTMTFSKDPDVIQNENWQKGWQNATVIDEAPFEEDFNAISFVNSYNTAYLLQKGIPEYSENTTYFKGSICMIIDNNGEPTLYYSKTDNNLNHNPTTDTTNWAQIASLYNNNFVLIDGSNSTFNNLSTTAKEVITSLASPSNRNISNIIPVGTIITPETPQYYTAPANGWVFIEALSASNAQTSAVYLYNTKAGIGTLQTVYGLQNIGSYLFIPVSKNDTVMISTASNNFKIDGSRFVYNNGN